MNPLLRRSSLLHVYTIVITIFTAILFFILFGRIVLPESPTLTLKSVLSTSAFGLLNTVTARQSFQTRKARRRLNSYSKTQKGRGRRTKNQKRKLSPDLKNTRRSLRALSKYNGIGKGRARVVHSIIVLLGVMMMVSGAVGSMFTSWLVLAGSSDLDEEEDGFQYWIGRNDEENDDDIRAHGHYREEKLTFLRQIDN